MKSAAPKSSVIFDAGIAAAGGARQPTRGPFPARDLTATPLPRDA